MRSTLDNVTASPELISDIVDNIFQLSDIIRDQLEDIRLKYFKRIRKLTPEILLYIICVVSTTSESYHTVLDRLKNNGVIDIKEQSVNEKLQQIKYDDIEVINNKICDNFYYGKERRIIAVDCMRIHLYESLNESGIPKSQNGVCCTAIISGMIDVETNIPINYHLHVGSNERDAFREQKKYINKDTDTLIFDRGYFSESFYSELYNERINAISEK